MGGLQFASVNHTFKAHCKFLRSGSSIEKLLVTNSNDFAILNWFEASFDQVTTNLEKANRLCFVYFGIKNSKIQYKKTMRCDRCGVTVADEHRFCFQCGFKIGNAQSKSVHINLESNSQKHVPLVRTTPTQNVDVRSTVCNYCRKSLKRNQSMYCCDTCKWNDNDI